MSLSKKIILIFVLGGMLTGCASNQLSAPCDEHAHFCGVKTPINHWE